MPRGKSTGDKKSPKRPIESYTHADKDRPNNPPVGLVTPDTDPEAGKKAYQYDPHLDPTLVWAGKAEHTSFDVPTVSLHVHERIDPRSIVEAVRKRNGTGPQLSLFHAEREAPIRQEIEFYRHRHNWTNRLVAGDSLLVMNSLLEKEGLAGQVQMVYIDPPYGISYRSNFQPFVGQRQVSESDRDDELTHEPETIRAFRDTWELGVHSTQGRFVKKIFRRASLRLRRYQDGSQSIFVDETDPHIYCPFTLKRPHVTSPACF